MSQVVHKYLLSPGSGTRMPRGAKLLHVGVQDGVAYVWALVDPHAEFVSRGILIHPTGLSVLDGAQYVGTFVTRPEATDLVFHVFDMGATA
jgi:hypothetical protein